MTKSFHITLDEFDLGQLLDGLRSRAEAWRRTTDYLESGYCSDDSFICEDCSNPEEARRISRHYERLVTDIKRQMAEQSGSL